MKAPNNCNVSCLECGWNGAASDCIREVVSGENYGEMIEIILCPKCEEEIVI